LSFGSFHSLRTIDDLAIWYTSDMELPENVKVKPRFWEFLPWLSSYTAQAIYPNIYFSRKALKRLSIPNPDPIYVAALIHEQEHIKRQKKEGWFKWGLKYVFSGRFRFSEELEAIRSSMKYLKEKKIRLDINKRARYLSSWLYFWPVSYERAKKELGKMWGEI
jgi:hypothetical protein